MTFHFYLLDQLPPANSPPGLNGPHTQAQKEVPKSFSSGFGYKWHDTVAIGQYDFDIHRMACSFPEYLGGKNGSYYHPAAKYYIPFRALTSWDSPNLLIAGT